ncbi:hypothetical protein [Clostridium baratii]|uniref:hypothetical protein n=1 Tax=Clostridium baratii TaxID=1561 RepID=UPI0030D2C86D
MKGKKIALTISLIMGASIMFSGCSTEKTIVLDTNIKEINNVGANLKEEIINLDLEDNELFTPHYIEGNKIYGVFGLSSKTGVGHGTSKYLIDGIFKENYYTLDKSDNLSESKRKPAIYETIGDMDIEGVGQYDPLDKLIYKYNNKTGKKEEIGKLDKANEEKVKGHYLPKVQTIEGNEDYAYIMECEEKVTYEHESKGEDKLLRLDIINLKDNKKYTYKGKDISRIDDIVYSKITEKFYALDNSGVLYDVSLTGDEIKFKKESKIDKKDIMIFETDGISINSSGEIVILNVYGEGETLAIIYNPETKKSNYIDKGESESLYIAKYWKDSNKAILAKQNENGISDIYVGELQSESIKIYKKLNIKLEDGEKSNVSAAIMSDDGKKILVRTNIYKEKDNKYVDYRYQFNLIEIG